MSNHLQDFDLNIYYQKFVSSYTTDDEYLKYAKTRMGELKAYAG